MPVSQCSACDFAFKPSDLFCTNCGKRLPPTDSSPVFEIIVYHGTTYKGDSPHVIPFAPYKVKVIFQLPKKPPPNSPHLDPNDFLPHRLSSLLHSVTRDFEGQLDFSKLRDVEKHLTLEQISRDIVSPILNMLAEAWQLPTFSFSVFPLDQPQTAILPDAIKDRHVYIAGQSGYGKSSLMYEMALRDITAMNGVAVLDPKSDLTTQLLIHMPQSRLHDAIYLSGGTPIPLDFLAYETPEERSLVAQDVITVFHRLMELGERMEPVLKWTIQALLDARDCCFFDIYNFLADLEKRKTILGRVTDPDVLHFWNVQFITPYYRGAEVPILSRMTDFVLIPSLQKILGISKSKLTISQIINDGQVLLVDLGSFGTDATKILGCLITSQIQQVIFRRRDTPEAVRNPYYLYADEFQDFKNNAFNEIVRKARGFKLGLNIANLHPKQIPDIFDDILGCVSSFILFRMDASHARMLASKIRPFKPEEIEKLPQFRALYCSADGRVEFIDTPRPPAPAAHPRADYIRKRTLDLYSCKTDPRPHNLNSGKPEPEGTVLPNEAQAADSRPARPVFRAAEQGPRTASSRPGSDPNRRPDDKPDP